MHKDITTKFYVDMKSELQSKILSSTLGNDVITKLIPSR